MIVALETETLWFISIFLFDFTEFPIDIDSTCLGGPKKNQTKFFDTRVQSRTRPWIRFAYSRSRARVAFDLGYNPRATNTVTRTRPTTTVVGQIRRFRTTGRPVTFVWTRSGTHLVRGRRTYHRRAHGGCRVLCVTVPLTSCTSIVIVEFFLNSFKWKQN